MNIVCKICNTKKTLEDMVKDKSKKYGVRNICKCCENKRRRKTTIKPTPKDGYKYCAKCNKELLLIEFNIRTVNEKQKPFSYCKECERNMNNNRYTHVCSKCGKKYRSGTKNGRLCKKCYLIEFGKQGKKRLAKFNSNQSGENNYFYGSHRTGKENPNYNPNKTDEERERGRLIEGYSEWVNDVYKRDNYTCRVCGYSNGHILVAHHLDGYNWCKEKRTDVTNGITLCEKCHKEFHSKYGYKDNTKDQFDLFISNKLIPR